MCSWFHEFGSVFRLGVASHGCASKGPDVTALTVNKSSDTGMLVSQNLDFFFFVDDANLN